MNMNDVEIMVLAFMEGECRQVMLTNAQRDSIKSMLVVLCKDKTLPLSDTTLPLGIRFVDGLWIGK